MKWWKIYEITYVSVDLGKCKKDLQFEGFCSKKGKMKKPWQIYQGFSFGLEGLDGEGSRGGGIDFKPLWTGYFSSETERIKSVP